MDVSFTDIYSTDFNNIIVLHEVFSKTGLTERKSIFYYLNENRNI